MGIDEVKTQVRNQGGKSGDGVGKARVRSLGSQEKPRESRGWATLG